MATVTEPKIVSRDRAILGYEVNYIRQSREAAFKAVQVAVQELERLDGEIERLAETVNRVLEEQGR